MAKIVNLQGLGHALDLACLDTRLETTDTTKSDGVGAMNQQAWTRGHQSRGRPSPALVGAWETLGTLRTELVPMWAAYWLAQGQDGEGIVALASLDSSDIREVHDLLPDALADAGVEPISKAGAAARLAFDHIARMHLDGKAGWRWVLTAVTGVFEQNDYGREFHDDPLGALYGLEDEVAGGWGRRPAEIEVEVHDACERQVQLTK